MPGTNLHGTYDTVNCDFGEAEAPRTYGERYLTSPLYAALME